MIYIMKRARVLAVIIQLLLLSLPIYADFDPSNPPEPNVTHRLTVLMNPSDIGYTGGSGSYRAGDGAYVYSYPYDWNYKLKYWTINGYRYHETSNEFWYTMGDSAVTFVAYYEYEEPTPPPFEPGNPPEPYVKQNITVDIDPAGVGYTSGAGSYSYNDGVYICAYIDYEYEFEYWTVNGYPWPETNQCFYYQVGDTNAHFVAHVSKKHMITLKTQPRAAGTSSMQMNGMPIGNQLVARGKKLDFSTIGNQDYKFSHWTINGYKHTTATSFNYTVGDSAAAVVAMYDYIGTGDTTMYNPDSPPEPDLRFDVTIIVVSENDAKGTTDGGGTYVYGTTDTLYAYPAEGFEFRYWNDGVQDNPRIIYATQDSLFVAYFGNDTIARTDTICYGEHLQIGDVILDASGHYEFYTSRPDGIYIWNIVDLTVLDRMYTSLDTTICYGETLWFGGKEYTATGLYLDTIQARHGCDSIVRVDLTILPEVLPSHTYDTITRGDTYYWNGNAYTIGGNYTMNLSDINGCDSLDILHLYVEAPITMVYDTICEGETYYLTIHGVMYSMQSDTIMQVFGPEGEEYVYVYLHKLPIIPETVIDTAICYGETYFWDATSMIYTASTKDTMVLTGVSGCDSVVTLNLTVYDPVPVTVVDTTICYGESFWWNADGVTYTTTTHNQKVTLTNSVGCDSIVILNLTVLPAVAPTKINAITCHGVPFFWDVTGKYYTGSQLVDTMMTDIHGCDSLVSLDLLELPAIDTTVINATTCYGVPYLWSVTGQNYMGTQTVDAVLSSFYGCDSVVRLNLVELPEIPVTEIKTAICYGETYYFEANGMVYTSSTDVTVVLTDQYGCDSVVHLNLTVIDPSQPTIVEQTICHEDKTYTWPANGVTYDKTGYYSTILTSSAGCDSTVVLNLVVLAEIPETIIDTTICYGSTYVFHGVEYDHPIVVSDTLPSVVTGCDSVVTLNLKMWERVPDSVTNATICYGETYVWSINGLTYTGRRAGEYHYEDFYYSAQTGCEGKAYLNLTVLPRVQETVVDTAICDGEAFYWHGNVYYTSIYNESIVLTDQNGCDSVVVLNLTVNASNGTYVDFQTICEGETYCWAVIGECFTHDTIAYYTDACNNNYSLDLTVRKNPDINDTVLVVEGSEYSWYGQVYTTSGHYTTTLQDDFGCEYTANLYITFVKEMHWDTFCEGNVYTWENHFLKDGKTPMTFTEPGTYLDTIVAANGEEMIYVLYLSEVALPELTVRPDTTIHLGDSVLLWASGADYIHWTSDDYLTQSDELRYYAKPKVTTTYTVTGYNLANSGANVVYNGNFDEGNVGFYTDCRYFTPYTSPGSYGTYTIADDVKGFWMGHVKSVKAYGGTGNMMILDGKTTANSIVWQQTVNVKPHTYYAFSAQVMSALDSYYEGRYALLQFNVDGEDIGPIFHSPNELYVWNEFYNMWYSGDKTTATLTIFNQNANNYGNDFAIDEISLIELQTTCQDEETVTVTVDLPSLVDTVVCSNDIPFVWNGLTVDTAGLYQTYVLSSNGKVDSIATMIVNIAEESYTILYDTICYGEMYDGLLFSRDTITTTILTNAQGCDSIVTLNLTVLTDIEVEYDTICFGESYYWNGMWYNQSGVHTFSYTNQYGCEAWRYLHLHVLDSIPTTTIDTTLCYGALLWFEGKEYTTSGVYLDTLQATNGCDSVIILDLTVLPEVPETVIYDTTCFDVPYVWNVDGNTYTSTTSTSVTLTDINGCDSIVTLHLTVLPEIPITEEFATICYGDTYNWYRNTYSTSGRYTKTLQDIHGCDSVIILDLTVLPKVPETVIYETTCFDVPYVWSADGKTYTSTTSTSVTLTDINGCDSVVTLHLTVLPEVDAIEEWAEICYGESYTWHGNIYTKSGDYKTTYTNEYGCLGEIVLHLTVWPKNAPIEEWAIITEGQTYTWYDLTYDTEGDYSIIIQDQHGCDQEVILHLEVQTLDFTITANEACADDPYIDFELQSDITIQRVEFQFDASGQWRDTVVYMPKQYISIPNNARAGIYSATISAYADNRYLGTKTLEYSLRYPSSVLDQHWDDFIGVLTHNYNGGYDFISFQWYKDDKPIPGETKSYISTTLEMGAQYSALLEDINGTKLMTCPIVATHQEELYLYPSLVEPEQIIYVRTSHAATIEMYNITGTQLLKAEYESGENHLQAPNTSGVYIVKIIYHDDVNKVLTRKITIR